MTKLKPLGNRVVVKRNEAKTSKGGILLPDSAQEKPKEGTILATGPGSYDDKGNFQEMELNVGDQVLFSSYAGTEFKSNDEEFIIMSTDEVLAVLSAS